MRLPAVSGAGLLWATVAVLPALALGMPGSWLLRSRLLTPRQVRRLGMRLAAAGGVVAAVALVILGDWGLLLLDGVLAIVLFEGFRLALFCPSCPGLVHSAALNRKVRHCWECGATLVLWDGTAPAR